MYMYVPFSDSLVILDELQSPLFHALGVYIYIHVYGNTVYPWALWICKYVRTYMYVPYAQVMYWHTRVVLHMYAHVHVNLWIFELTQLKDKMETIREKRRQHKQLRYIHVYMYVYVVDCLPTQPVLTARASQLVSKPADPIIIACNNPDWLATSVVSCLNLTNFML